MDLERLLHEIEQSRFKMHQMAERQSLSSQEMLEKSRKLDRLLNHYRSRFFS